MVAGDQETATVVKERREAQRQYLHEDNVSRSLSRPSPLTSPHTHPDRNPLPVLCTCVLSPHPTAKKKKNIKKIHPALFPLRLPPSPAIVVDRGKKKTVDGPGSQGGGGSGDSTNGRYAIDALRRVRESSHASLQRMRNGAPLGPGRRVSVLRCVKHGRRGKKKKFFFQKGGAK